MKTLVVLFFITVSATLRAQNLETKLLSLQRFGSSGNFISVFTYDLANNDFVFETISYTFPGPGTLDTFCSGQERKDIFIKYNADASTIDWTRCYGYFDDSSVLFRFPLSGDAVVLAGGFTGSHEDGGFYISKEDAAGSVIWQKNYSKGNHALLYDIRSASDGGYMLMGTNLWY